MTDTADVGFGLPTDEHRRLGKELFNHVWTLLELEDRTPEQVDEMVAAAHASRFHWARAGTDLQLGRADWQISRVYATLGRAEPALWHANRCLELIEREDAAGRAEDWDVAAALEGLARAQAVAGLARAVRTRERAREALARISDPEDRDLIAADLDSVGR